MIQKLRFVSEDTEEIERSLVEPYRCDTGNIDMQTA